MPDNCGPYERLVVFSHLNTEAQYISIPFSTSLRRYAPPIQPAVENSNCVPMSRNRPARLAYRPQLCGSMESSRNSALRPEKCLQVSEVHFEGRGRFLGLLEVLEWILIVAIYCWASRHEPPLRRPMLLADHSYPLSPLRPAQTGR